MNKYLSWVFVLVVLGVVLIAGYLVLSGAFNQNSTSQNPTTGLLQNKNAQPSPSQVPNIPEQTVTLTNTGFQPQTLTIQKGTRVIWLNKSGTVGGVNSDYYPTNILYPFLNFGLFDDGSSFSTVFDKPGTYTYYNYSNQTQTGKIIAQ